jgi:hypothetical protein
MAIDPTNAGTTGDDGPGNAITQVCGAFTDQDKLDEAMSRLEGSAFQRADLSTQQPGQAHQDNVMREDDARSLRTLGTSTAAAVAALAAAGVVVATGGAALPAMVAAAVAGGTAGAAGTVIGQVAAPGAQDSAHQAAEGGGVVLLVHAASPEKRAKAEEVLRACGATRVWLQATV